jgi:hypothetical protein
MRDEYLSFLKQLPRCATNSDACFRIRTVFNRRFYVSGIKLAPGEGMIAAKKRQLFTATNQKYFRIARVGVVTKENDGSRVSGG